MISTLARMYPVTTQVICSIVTPIVPLMVGSATLTMLESSTAMIVPVITEPAMIHLWTGSPSWVATNCPLSGLYVSRDRHARTQRAVCAATTSDRNAHRNALHDL